MRVLHLYSGNLYGGIERMLWTLARHARLRPWLDQHFALCFHGRLRDELVDVGVPLHDLGAVRASRPWSILTARARLRAVLEARAFDAVIAHAGWTYAMFAPVVRRMDIPLAFYAHDQHTGRHWFERWAKLTPPDMILASSRFIAEKVKSIFSEPEARIVPLAVAPPESPRPRAQVRASVGEREDAVVIALAARLEEWKGHRLLIAALSKIKHRPTWSCWLIGGAQRPHEQSYLDELHAAARRGGIHHRIRLLGQRSDVPDLLNAADIHCQPNTGPEPFGIAFIEAMYAGLPIVTTAIGGPLEYVGRDAGILVEPNNPDALAGALERLIDDPTTRLTLGQGARRSADFAHPAKVLRLLESELSTFLTASTELEEATA